jgi:8-oxo-dGTP pyrophosphatase MutT (NUDIX family)
MTDIATAGILLRAPSGRVLLLRRTGEGDHEGEWAIPGGKLKQGENAREAAVRELFEETGYRTHAGKFHARRVRDGIDYTTFLVDTEDEIVPALNHEHDAFLWVDPQEALAMGKTSRD